jgi:hypothetical protein
MKMGKISSTLSCWRVIVANIGEILMIFLFGRCFFFKVFLLWQNILLKNKYHKILLSFIPIYTTHFFFPPHKIRIYLGETWCKLKWWWWWWGFRVLGLGIIQELSHDGLYNGWCSSCCCCWSWLAPLSAS